MRTISDDMREVLQDVEHSTIPIILLTIDHADFATPVRVSSDNTQRITVTDAEVLYGTVSRGNNYLYYPFDLKLPTDEEEGTPKTSLTIDNVSAWITSAIESIDPRTPVTVDIEVVLSTSPDTVEVEFTDFTLKNVKYDMYEVTGEISMDTLFGEPVPQHSMTPSYFPGAHNVQ